MEFFQDILRIGDQIQTVHEDHLDDFTQAFENTAEEVVDEYSTILSKLPDIKKKLLKYSSDVLEKTSTDLQALENFLDSLGSYYVSQTKLDSLVSDYSMAASPMVDSSLAFTVREPGTKRENVILHNTKSETQYEAIKKMLHCIAENVSGKDGILEWILSKLQKHPQMFSFLLVEVLKARGVEKRTFKKYIESAKSEILQYDKPKPSPFKFRSLGLVPAGPWSLKLDPKTQASRMKASLLILERSGPECVRYDVSKLVDRTFAEKLMTSRNEGLSEKFVKRTTVVDVDAGTKKFEFKEHYFPGKDVKKIVVYEKCGKWTRPLSRRKASFNKEVAVSESGTWVEYFTKPARPQRIQGYQENRQHYVCMLAAPIEEDEIQRRSESLANYSKLRTDLLSALTKYARGRNLEKLTGDEHFLDIVPSTIISIFRDEYERALPKEGAFAEIISSFLSRLNRVKSQFSKQLFDMHRAGKKSEAAVEGAVDKIVQKNKNVLQSLFYRIELLKEAKQRCIT